MMAPGLKPVGWVAAVATAALSCYMLSLNVASERAELARIERQIIATKQDIRTLQTELGTRGRLAQLEQWNADVLALSAPATTQFLDSEVKLARFDQRVSTLDERAKVRMASADAASTARAKIDAPVIHAAVPAMPTAATKIAAPLIRAAVPVVSASTLRASPRPAPALSAPSALQPQPMVHKVSLQLAAAKPVLSERSLLAGQNSGRKSAGNRIDDQLRKEIRAVADDEAGRDGR